MAHASVGINSSPRQQLPLREPTEDLVLSSLWDLSAPHSYGPVLAHFPVPTHPVRTDPRGASIHTLGADRIPDGVWISALPMQALTN